MSKRIHYGMSNKAVKGSDSDTNCDIPSGARRMSVKDMSGGREFSLRNDLMDAVEEQQRHDVDGFRKFTKPSH